MLEDLEPYLDAGKNDLFAGEEGVWLGYPMEEGESACRGVAKDTLCIASASRHKDGAWSFLESWLGSEIGYGARGENGFMTRKRELHFETNILKKDG